MAAFHSIQYERVHSTDDESHHLMAVDDQHNPSVGQHQHDDTELPPTFVSTRGTECNGDDLLCHKIIPLHHLIPIPHESSLQSLIYQN